MRVTSPAWRRSGKAAACPTYKPIEGSRRCPEARGVSPKADREGSAVNLLPKKRAATQRLGHCLRAPVQGSCPYANICEHCPSFHTTSDYIPVLTQQREDATALADDATGRGWDSETERHLKLINRINDLITHAAARGQAM